MEKGVISLIDKPNIRRRWDGELMTFFACVLVPATSRRAGPPRGHWTRYHLQVARAHPGTAFSQAPGRPRDRPGGRAVIRESMGVNGGLGRNHAAGQPVPPQDQYRDLDLLTPDDVYALLKVKKSWLYDAVENGVIEAIRLGKQLRFRPSALLRYLEERVSNGKGSG
jgi:excisionase family DNA binding protein